MSKLVTVAIALALRNLGYNEERATRYAYKFDKYDKKNNKFRLQQGYILYKNSDNPTSIISIPTVDEIIDWLRRKYHIIIYDATEPFVDPISKCISFSYKVKYCDLKWGWNQRKQIGQTKWSNDSYVMKRQAIWIAIRYIKKKWSKRHKSFASK